MYIINLSMYITKPCSYPQAPTPSCEKYADDDKYPNIQFLRIISSQLVLPKLSVLSCKESSPVSETECPRGGFQDLHYYDTSLNDTDDT